jgi:microcystin-dependent protein
MKCTQIVILSLIILCVFIVSTPESRYSPSPIVSAGRSLFNQVSGKVSAKVSSVNSDFKLLTVSTGDGDIQALDPYKIMPVGSIILWHGVLSSIPVGWKLCDGQNGTPDLRDRFVIGAGATHEWGAQGGEDEITLTEANIPNHTHELDLHTQIDGSHSHNPEIEHVRRLSRTGQSSDDTNAQAGALKATHLTDRNFKQGITNANIVERNVGMHRHKIQGSTKSTEKTVSPVPIIPKFVALYYIKRVD